jgi:single-stranded DNA-binding protein
MQNYSNATIEGFVTHEPQLRKTKTGKSVCSFSLAINHYSKSDEPPRVSSSKLKQWGKNRRGMLKKRNERETAYGYGVSKAGQMGG